MAVLRSVGTAHAGKSSGGGMKHKEQHEGKSRHATMVIH